MVKQDFRVNKFLSQCYIDAQKDYQYSFHSYKVELWDWVIITASNENQAYAYQKQIDLRLKDKRLNNYTKYAVIPDPEGKRIGSGSATLNAIKYVFEHSQDDLNLNKCRIMLIHSGGDSKRIPQYSVCGKLFAPIPHNLSNGHIATLFDEIMITMSGVASRVNGGILVIPGDSQIIFNPLQLDLTSVDVAALSVKTSFYEGKEHGVFLNGANNVVSKFLHKESEMILKSSGAVDNNGMIDIDTGYIWISSKVSESLYKLISDNRVISKERCSKYINDKVRLNFYADFIYPMASDSTLEDYLSETPEGDFSTELESCRKEIWAELSKYKIKLIKLNPASYIHFGTTWELLKLFTNNISDFDYLKWNKHSSCNSNDLKTGTCNNCLISESAVIDSNSYCEDSRIGDNVIVSENVILSNVNLSDIEVPSNVVLNTIRLDDSQFVTRIYGINDNPKSSIDGSFLGITLRDFLDRCNEPIKNIWTCRNKSIWSAKIYPICDSEKESIKMALIIHRIAMGNEVEGDVDSWKKYKKMSLEDGMLCADLDAYLENKTAIENEVSVQKSIDILSNPKIDLNHALSYFKNRDEINYQRIGMILENIKNYDMYCCMRIYMMISLLCKDCNCNINNLCSDEYEDMAYRLLSESIVNLNKMQYHTNIGSLRFVSKEITVKLPVRINFCGSPSDAAPYCTTYGGTMINAAIKLKNELPISVTVKRLDEPVIMFESIDGNFSCRIDNISDIQNCGNTHDKYSLYKSVLIASGVVPNITNNNNQTLKEILTNLGGGLSISTSVNIPKGSGLGTSSILAAACVKAVNNILGSNVSDECLYSQVFSVEQLMNTGGGWQDQIGGYIPGIKYIKSKPGLSQNLFIDTLNLDDDVWSELQERFLLVFSGQRRLAKNVLRQEMNASLIASEQILSSMKEIQHLCVLMRYELENGNVDSFANYITDQFEIVKRIDSGASNSYIEYIFSVCDDLITGKSICGAGGGGFLQMILKKGISKEQVQKRLNYIFGDSEISVWDCEFIRSNGDTNE